MVWLGETDGVRDRDGHTIARLSAAAALRTARRVIGASGVDVTGGMALRLRAAGALAKAGVGSAIVDGRKSGPVAAAMDTTAKARKSQKRKSPGKSDA